MLEPTGPRFRPPEAPDDNCDPDQQNINDRENKKDEEYEDGQFFA